ncbi:hypothetical protein ABZP36_009441 [Zizania latifolia]
MHAIVISYGFQVNLFVSNALLYLYVDFGCLREAVMLFPKMAVKDSVTWSTMIGGLVHNGRSGSALKLFCRMMLNSTILITRFILLNVIMACAELGEWKEGKWVEENYVCCNGFEFKCDPSVVTALIYMYAKCGMLDLSVSLLHGIEEVRDGVVAWNVMIKGCGELGLVEKAVGIVIEMQKIGVDPDAITFLGILPIISSIPSLKTGMEAHAQIARRGLVEEGMELLKRMQEQCGLEPSVEMLILAGRLTDAYHLIKDNSSEHFKNTILWGMLLNASCSCGDLVIGEAASKHLLSLDPENQANYKMLSDIYVSLGRRDESDNLLRISMSRGLHLGPGCSWMEGVYSLQYM